MLIDCGHMERGGVANIMLPAVLRITPSQTPHEPVSRDLCDYRRARNRVAATIATYNGSVSNAKILYRAAIQNDVIGYSA